ncbi:hypothetical protein OMES3154_00094 [Oceanivirga miroungae]|uniref:Uncharacterized protein n=1 Tax=Oceanivirga miroungae TaxID=1130046 RepID=A0A6I8M7P2_9FUSO|nr:hypothetical protein OMES3154_00094 [Oceanivirga miroungae]
MIELKFFLKEELDEIKIVNKQHIDIINDFFSNSKKINR